MNDPETLALGKKRAEGLLERGVILHGDGIVNAPGRREYYFAEDIHRLLGSAIEVSGAIEGEKVVQPFGMVTGGHDTHTALLISIREIQPESEERQIIKDFVSCFENSSMFLGPFNELFAKTFERARALLAKGEK